MISAKHLFWIGWLGLGAATAQPTVTLSGRIADGQGMPLPGANVWVEGTYDGASTAADGAFRFVTTAAETVTLQVAFTGYVTVRRALSLPADSAVGVLRLREDITALAPVTISAGAFEASDEHRSVMLRPLDVVTTAGAEGDPIAAFQFLPGAQRVGEQEGLFVRGGDARETQVLIDGLRVQNPFFSAVPDVPQRSRFSPFLFKGMTFSTGGYSAQYGQALSSVLLLEMADLPDSTQSSLSLTAAGLSAAHTQRWARTALATEVGYTHLGALWAVVPQQADWQQVPRGPNGQVSFHHDASERHRWKAYGAWSQSRLALRMGDFAHPTQAQALALANQNAYGIGTYRGLWGQWGIRGGISYSYDHDATRLDQNAFDQTQQRWQGRLSARRTLGTHTELVVGAEGHRYAFGWGVMDQNFRFSEIYGAVFAETESHLSRRLALRTGLRGEHTTWGTAQNLAPRVSLAFKTGAYSQVAAAWGHFYQSPDRARYLLPGYERADHYLVNYQVMKNARTFRLEGYYKDYRQLVRERSALPFDPNPWRFATGPLDLSGEGYAHGLDIFWRDQQAFRRIDYWVSYSLLDTRRLYQQFPVAATPTFASAHNLSLVGKYWIAPIRTALGATYVLASGRPYYNPQATGFLTDRTPNYQNLSLNVSYQPPVRSCFAVLFASAGNVLGRDNVFGYRYSPDGTGRAPVRQAALRTFFAGAFISF